jgi:hypothetical protein
MLDYKDLIISSNKYFSFNRKVFSAQVEFVANKTEFDLKKKLFNGIPL